MFQHLSEIIADFLLLKKAIRIEDKEIYVYDLRLEIYIMILAILFTLLCIILLIYLVQRIIAKFIAKTAMIAAKEAYCTDSWHGSGQTKEA